MHFRRLAALALGAWLGGSIILMSFTARNAGAVDQLIRAPAKAAVEYMVKLPEPDLRMLLNYHGSEVNRGMRRNWDLIQFGLGALVLVGLFFGSGGKRYTMPLCLLMLVSVAFLHWFLAPEIAKVARSADLVPTGTASLARDRLRSLESGYTTTEALKLGFGFLMAWGLLKSGRRRRHEPEVE